MFARFTPTVFIATLLLGYANATAAEADVEREFFSASGELTGFVLQIRNFYRACGERLGERDSYRDQQAKWTERNPQIVRADASAVARVDEWMSPQQREQRRALESRAYEATVSSLRDLEQAKITCASFLKRMESAEDMQAVVELVVKPFLAAEKALESSKRGAE